MSLTLAYIGAAAGAAPAASLRALSGGGAVFVPAGLEGKLRELVAEAADPGFGRLLELDPADGEGLDDLVRRAADGETVVALAGPGGPQLARELRRRAASAAAVDLVTVPTGQAFDDALLGQELVSLKRIVDVLRVECPWDREQTPQRHRRLHRRRGPRAGRRDRRRRPARGARRARRPAAAGRAARPHARTRRAPATSPAWPTSIEVKLIRRHPHIFADAVADTPAEVKSRWERIKVEQEGRQGIFHDVPTGFPALLYAKKLQQRAASVGFDWDSAAEAFPEDRGGARRAGGAVRRGGRRRHSYRPAPRRPPSGARGRRPALRHRERGAPAARGPRAGAARGRQPLRAPESRRRRSWPPPRARTGRRWSLPRRRRTTSAPRPASGRLRGRARSSPGGSAPGSGRRLLHQPDVEAAALGGHESRSSSTSRRSSVFVNAAPQSSHV